MDNVGLFFLIHNFSGKDKFLDYLMIFGARGVILIALLLFFILAFRGSIKEKRAFLLTLVSYPLALFLIKIIHVFFIEERPFVTLHLTPLYYYLPDPSFPSIHTATMTVMALSYLYFRSNWSFLFLLLMIWVGIARIYVGVHYPLDILGGFIVGIASITISIKITRLLKLKFF